MSLVTIHLILTILLLLICISSTHKTQSYNHKLTANWLQSITFKMTVVCILCHSMSRHRQSWREQLRFEVSRKTWSVEIWSESVEIWSEKKRLDQRFEVSQLRFEVRRKTWSVEIWSEKKDLISWVQSQDWIAWW